MKRVCWFFVCLFCVTLPGTGFAQVKSSQPISPTQQAAFGWIWAKQSVEECGEKLRWNTTSGQPVRSNQATKLLVSEGHRRNEIAKALRTKGALPFVQLDRWLVDAGFKPNADNIGSLLCILGERTAGTVHPMGRFLAVK